MDIPGIIKLRRFHLQIILGTILILVPFIIFFAKEPAQLSNKLWWIGTVISATIFLIGGTMLIDGFTGWHKNENLIEDIKNLEKQKLEREVKLLDLEIKEKRK
ncbi:hypothetical protein HYV81_00610 [Candidatus Woesearchaeota archaeon]|nr:hypothetical protein [Candidatus Woesearchaeota archaeon]